MRCRKAVELERKNRAIKASLKATKRRRKLQICRQYELKLDKSRLSNSTLRQLLMLFLEAKWFHNHLLAAGDLFDADYKASHVEVRVGDRYETRPITNLSSQMRQELVDRIRDNIRGLSALKKNGHKVGKLRYKSAINSIPLKQYRNTWAIIDRHHVRIQGITQSIRVRGLNQMPKGADLASALLIRKHGDFYLHVTTYQPKPAIEAHGSNERKPGIGLDFGVKNQLTTSSGGRVNYEVPVTGRLIGLCRQLSRRKKHSRNWHKTLIKLEREYDRTVNTKHDVTNKIAHALTTKYGTVCAQNDSLRSWQRLWGKRMLDTQLGGITRALRMKAQTLSTVDRWFASTKKCSRCDNVKDEMPLTERTYNCDCDQCGLVMDRDLNAATNVLREGLRLLGATPMESRSTPADTRANHKLLEYLNSIPRVRASRVEETGSPRQIHEPQTEAHDFSHG
jgi:transposase